MVQRLYYGSQIPKLAPHMSIFVWNDVVQLYHGNDLLGDALNHKWTLMFQSIQKRMFCHVQ